MPKIIAVIPVFNEAKTLADVLGRISSQVDILVCVNDGSTDKSLSMLEDFARKRKNTYIVDRPLNGGMAGALKSGFLFVLYLEKIMVVAGGDIVVTIDADGQHKPEYIDEIVKYFIVRKADVVLTRRDFSVYPLYKILGNRFLTWTNSLLSGVKYNDVESGLRFLKIKTLRPILNFYTGVRYSCAQEIALISAGLGFKIDNDFQVGIAYYRPGTTLGDGFIVLFMSVLTYFRLKLHINSKLNLNESLMEQSYSRSKGFWRRDQKKRRTVKNGS